MKKYIKSFYAVFIVVLFLFLQGCAGNKVTARDLENAKKKLTKIAQEYNELVKKENFDEASMFAVESDREAYLKTMKEYGKMHNIMESNIDDVIIGPTAKTGTVVVIRNLIIYPATAERNDKIEQKWGNIEGDWRIVANY